MFVMLAGWSVAAAVSMMASATRFEKAIPTSVSSSIRSSSIGPSSGAHFSGSLSGSTLTSSGLLGRLPKEEIGLIVVPSTATIIVA